MNTHTLPFSAWNDLLQQFKRTREDEEDVEAWDSPDHVEAMCVCQEEVDCSYGSLYEQLVSKDI